MAKMNTITDTENPNEDSYISFNYSDSENDSYVKWSFYNGFTTNLKTKEDMKELAKETALWEQAPISVEFRLSPFSKFRKENEEYKEVDSISIIISSEGISCENYEISSKMEHLWWSYLAYYQYGAEVKEYQEIIKEEPVVEDIVPEVPIMESKKKQTVQELPNHFTNSKAVADMNAYYSRFKKK